MSKEVLGKGPFSIIFIQQKEIMVPCRPDGEVRETDYDTKEGVCKFPLGTYRLMAEIE